MLGAERQSVASKKAGGCVHEIPLCIERQAKAAIVEGKIDTTLQRKTEFVRKVDTRCAQRACGRIGLLTENDEIAWSRYKSYTQILEGDEEQYRADIYDAERRASDETRKS